MAKIFSILAYYRDDKYNISLGLNYQKYQKYYYFLILFSFSFNSNSVIIK